MLFTKSVQSTVKPKANTGLFKMIVGVLTTCHTQYTWYGSMCIFYLIEQHSGDRGSTVVKVLCYKSEGRWFDPSCQWIFH